jgi:hypothetical protein
LRRPPKADLRKQIVRRSAEGMSLTPLQALSVSAKCRRHFALTLSIWQVGDCRLQNFQTVMKLKRATTLEFTTISPICYIHCYLLAFNILSVILFITLFQYSFISSLCSEFNNFSWWNAIVVFS